MRVFTTLLSPAEARARYLAALSPAPLGTEEAVRVPTGGMLPAGADAVVIQERTRVLGETVEVHRPVRPGENMISRGEDGRAGDAGLRAGRRLRPQDLGILAGLGHARVAVRL